MSEPTRNRKKEERGKRGSKKKNSQKCKLKEGSCVCATTSGYIGGERENRGGRVFTSSCSEITQRSRSVVSVARRLLVRFVLMGWHTHTETYPPATRTLLSLLSCYCGCCCWNLYMRACAIVVQRDLSYFLQFTAAIAVHLDAYRWISWQLVRVWNCAIATAAITNCRQLLP